MVTMSTLEKITHDSKLSDRLPISPSSAARDNKLDRSGEDGNVFVNAYLSRSVSQNQNKRSDVYLDSTLSKGDRQLLGVIGGQNESSLFSSSLSDLVNHKLKMSSNKFLSSRQLSDITSQKNEADAFKSQYETEGQTISNLLPDEEELFSGMVDEMGHMGHAEAIDELEDFDLFTCSGGIELESDDTLQAGQRNVGYPWGLNKNHHSIPSADHASRVIPTSRYPNGVILNDASSHENSHIYNGFQSTARLPSIGSEIGVNEASRSFPQVQLENRGIPSFHPHSHQMQLPSVGNIIPQNSLDGMRGIADEICSTVPEKVNFDLRHLGLNGHARELGDGAFAYSPNGINVHQSVTSKSNSYQQHHLRSLLIPNSPSFLNNNHAHNLGRLPGSPGAPHFMMSMASPTHQLQVGSAPVIKASIWDRQQIYAGESREGSGYQMGGIRGVGIPRFSPSHPREISSHGSFPHVNGVCAEMTKNSGVHSPQQMSHMFHERNAMNSMPISFGSPSERVRGRRNETHLSHADRKHYELNIDRILRGDDSRTTLMIKNIPNKYTSKMLLATIDEQHRGKYDFIYLPIDFKNKCNMGYAFINMVDALQIVAFHQTFEGRKWEKFNSEKVATLAYARIQGKAALIAHFQNSSLMNEDKRCRPILFHTDGPNAGDQEPFPIGTNFRPKPGRLQATGNEDEA